MNAAITHSLFKIPDYFCIMKPSAGFIGRAANNGSGSLTVPGNLACKCQKVCDGINVMKM
ncbi:hypothetical protein [Chitinophaga sp.]|uniref:hypothetical protein n=1 Tax=Chitinophaga sp. TaxID=1869181 RepID=UPI0025C55AEB|nr:hypothetical protein [Chitinophaga sp.]